MVCRGVRRAQPKPPRGERHGGGDGNQVELDGADAVSDGVLRRIVVSAGHGEAVVYEPEMKLARLQRPRDFLIVAGGEKRGVGRRMPPRRRVVGAVSRLQKGAEYHLAVAVAAHYIKTSGSCGGIFGQPN